MVESFRLRQNLDVVQYYSTFNHFVQEEAGLGRLGGLPVREKLAG